MTAEIDPHYDRPDIYDQFYGEFHELPDWFLEKLTGREQILELACGTGRISIPLAKSKSVTGLDLSPGMLRLAGEKASYHKTDVVLETGDMRDFELNRTFDAILLMFNSICHLHTVADLAACLSSVKKHLSPGGVFAISVFVPDLLFLGSGAGADPRLFATITDGGETYNVMETFRYDPAAQISRIIHTREGSGEVVGGLNLKMYFPAELDAALHYNGFEITAKYGDWDGGEFGPDSGHQIVFCCVKS